MNRIKILRVFFIIFVFIQIQLSVVAQVDFNGAKNCQANFNYEVVESISPLTINFIEDCESNFPVLSYIWSFGDGEFSYKKDPQHQFLEEGSYNVTLKIYTQNGDSSQTSKYVKVTAIAAQNCTSYFTYTRNTSSADFTYTFTDHSISTIGTINYWKWTFGDASPVVYTQNPIHQFMSTGTFPVTLETHSDSGCISLYTVNLLILSSPNPIDASFTFKKDTSLSNGLTFLFHDNSTSSSQITQWKWFFEDGDSSNVQDPTHTFPFGGVYYVKLMVKNLDGYSSELTIPVQVGSQSKYNLWGRVYAGSYVIDKCIAYLYKEFNNNYFVPTDTIRLTSVNDTLGVYYFFQKYEGRYRVKVLTSDNSVYTKDYAPTYYGGSKFWAQASTLNLFNNISQANVYLVAVNPNTGNAKISGKIINQSGKTIPKKDIELLLLDNSGNIISYTFSDSSGFFAFNNLGVGNYKVYVELTGFDCIPLNLTINNTNDSIVNTQIIFLNQTFIGLEENNETTNLPLSIYPNPSASWVWIDTKKEIIESVEIYNVAGILCEKIENTDKKSVLQIDISRYNSGIYIIKARSLKNQNISFGKFLKN